MRLNNYWYSYLSVPLQLYLYPLIQPLSSSDNVPSVPLYGPHILLNLTVKQARLILASACLRLHIRLLRSLIAVLRVLCPPPLLLLLFDYWHLLCQLDSLRGLRRWGFKSKVFFFESFGWIRGFKSRVSSRASSLTQSILLIRILKRGFRLGIFFFN